MLTFYAKEICLAENCLGQGHLQGRVHSVYRRAVNLMFQRPRREPLLLTLYVGGTALPDSIRLPSVDALATLVPDAPVRLGQQGLEWAGGRLEWSGLPLEDGSFARWGGRLRHAPGELAPFTQGSGFERLPPAQARTLRTALIRLGPLLCRPDWAGVQGLLAEHLGAGYGLTPSFDDAVVGMLALFWRAGWFCGVGAEVYHRLAALAHRSTTAVSAKYLCCALEGCFSADVRHLCDGLFAEAALLPAAQALAAVGSTSGRDSLVGVAAAVDHMLARGNGISPQGLPVTDTNEKAVQHGKTDKAI